MLSDKEVSALVAGDIVEAKDGRRRKVVGWCSRKTYIDYVKVDADETERKSERCFYGTMMAFGVRIIKAANAAKGTK